MRSDITPPSIQSPQARCPCRFDGKRNTNEATPKPVPPVAKADLPQKREATLAGNLAPQNEPLLPVKLNGDRVTVPQHAVHPCSSLNSRVALCLFSCPKTSIRTTFAPATWSSVPCPPRQASLQHMLLRRGEHASSISAAVCRDSQVD